MRSQNCFCRRWARVARQNCAEIRQNFLDFNGKSRLMNAKFRDKKHRRDQTNLTTLCIVRRMILGFFLASRARVAGRPRADFQSFACKIARISTAKLRNFGAERARRTHEKRADSFQTCLMPCHALLRFLACFYKRWARVACQKCAETRRKFCNFT